MQLSEPLSVLTALQAGKVGRMGKLEHKGLPSRLLAAVWGKSSRVIPKLLREDSQEGLYVPNLPSLPLPNASHCRART